MEPTPVRMPVSLSQATAAFAGLPDAVLSRDGPGRGLSEQDWIDLLRRLTVARKQAGLGGLQFRRLRRCALVTFCAAHGFSRMEVRVALAFIELTLSLRRLHRSSDRLIHMRQKRGTREETYQ